MVAFVFLCVATNIQAQEKDPLNPPVREGGYGDAVTCSGKNKALVLFILGGKGKKEEPEKYTASEYAKLLQAGFKNPKYTNYPTETVVYYRETNKYGPTVARIIINGLRYETDSGASVFSPSMIGNYIDVFTKYYREKNNIPLKDKQITTDNN
ncbi:hypothetical protein C8N46_11356 [Kordia periserrulae]|uniref:Uncharacterized protein n=2 Tax=Kordia periserrulae TaxID=701523 RepID=A0A2T6BR59_9FLAO|nr:hypothetical protein C8N46_11356 [Kordia periserrulae]